MITEERRHKLFLAAVLLTNIMTMLNTTTVTISLPSYMTIFGVDINAVQWVSVGYLLPLGMVMPLSEYLCERYSYRKVFLLSVAAMGICSLCCACSVTFFMLVFFRFLKGIARRSCHSLHHGYAVPFIFLSSCRPIIWAMLCCFNPLGLPLGLLWQVFCCRFPVGICYFW